MGASQNQIQYLNREGLSDVTIANMTGIPRSTVGFVRRGERSMPVAYRTPLRDTYRRVNYNVMREEGLSYHQARKYSSSDTVTSAETRFELRMLVTQFTRGAVTGALAKFGKLGIIPNLKQLAKDMMEKVKGGLRKSHKDFDTIRDYPFRKEKTPDEIRKMQEQALRDLGW